MSMTRRIATAGAVAASLVLAAASVEAQGQGAEPSSELSASDVMADLMKGSDADLETFRWTHRPVIVFADSPNDPRFAQQVSLLEAGAAELAERDVVILTDSDPSVLGPLREKLRPRGFMLVLIGKDGGVKLRKPFPWDVRELSRSIDKMPLRQREIRERRTQ